MDIQTGLCKDILKEYSESEKSSETISFQSTWDTQKEGDEPEDE